MVKFPKLKKKISSFLTKEEGKISKESLIKTGVLLSFAAMATSTVEAACPPSTAGGHSDHCNELSLNYVAPTAAGTHNDGHGNHSNHSSHGSHGSHGSHSSNGWPW